MRGSDFDELWALRASLSIDDHARAKDLADLRLLAMYDAPMNVAEFVRCAGAPLTAEAFPRSA